MSTSSHLLLEEEDVSIQEIEVSDQHGITATTIPASHQPIDHSMHTLLALLSRESAPLRPAPTDDEDRTKMCEWYYEMASFLKISSAAASRSMQYLDRFMACPSPTAEGARRCRDDYQLVALTTLFLSVKLYERLSIAPCHVSFLSRGRYAKEEVVQMEMRVLEGLRWEMAQPTKWDFAELILDCALGRMPGNKQRPHSDSTSAVFKEIRGLTMLQIQLSDFHAMYSSLRQSAVAVAAVMNAFEANKAGLDERDREVFRSTIRSLLAHHSQDHIQHVMDRLRCLVDPYSRHSPDAHSPPEYSSEQASISTCQETSIEALDAALDTVQDIHLGIMSNFLCCGSFPMTTSDPIMMERDAEKLRPDPNTMGSSDSFDGRESFKRTPCQGTKQSPNSITTMLFGTGY